ncbi:hypothetical protein HYV80_06980 [Candidatus Woesearchaeota archaeon]|nr:hypothetical protein [Candidatus Woesearchaeota archaeon]
MEGKSPASNLGEIVVRVLKEVPHLVAHAPRAFANGWLYYHGTRVPSSGEIRQTWEMLGKKETYRLMGAAAVSKGRSIAKSAADLPSRVYSELAEAIKRSGYNQADYARHVSGFPVPPDRWKIYNVPMNAVFGTTEFFYTLFLLKRLPKGWYDDTRANGIFMELPGDGASADSAQRNGHNREDWRNPIVIKAISQQTAIELDNALGITEYRGTRLGHEIRKDNEILAVIDENVVRTGSVPFYETVSTALTLRGYKTSIELVTKN